MLRYPYWQWCHHFALAVVLVTIYVCVYIYECQC